MSAHATKLRPAVSQAQRGFVLIVVLWAVAIVTIIALGFGRRAVLDTTAATYSVDYAQAMMLARGAAERGIVEVINKRAMDLIEQTQLEDNANCTHLGQPWARTGDLYKDDIFYSSDNKGENDYAVYTIEDADRYINLGAAPEELLRNVKSISPSTLKKIMYRRTQETHKGEGVTPFQAIEELRYLDGVDADDWYGTERKPGLEGMLTTYGSGKVNVNTASEDVLRSVPGLDPGLISKVITYRRGDDGKAGTEDDRGFRNLEDLGKKLGATGDGGQPIQQYCTFDSQSFIITGTATRQGGKVRASCTVIVDTEGNIQAWKEDPLGA